MPTIPSGLGATLGVKKEVSYGSEDTVTKWFLIDANEGFTIKKNIAQSNALSGGRFHLNKRRALVTKEATGKVSMDLCATGLGVFFANVLGSPATAVQQAASAAWLQNHYPGTTIQGYSLNFQKGIPATPSGTVTPFSYPGSKIVDMTISCAVNAIARLDMTLDCQNEDTVPSYAAPTFPTPNVFHFDQGAVLIGGSNSTTSNVNTISGGAAPTGVISQFTVKITNKFNTQRFNIGATTKSEQIENNFCDITGDIDIEFANVSDFYTAMAADTVTPLQINLTGPTIASTYKEFVQLVMANVRWESASPMASSPDVVKVKVPFTVLDDKTNPVININYQSTDVAV